MKKAFLHAAGLSLALSLGGLSLGAQAAVIYDEGASGDLSNAAPQALGTLAVGSNTVSGWVTATPGGDTDVFSVSLGANMEMVSVSLSFDTLENGEELSTSLWTPATNLFDDNFGNFSWGASSVNAAMQDTWDFGSGTGPLSGTDWNMSINSGVIFARLNWTATFVTRDVQAPPPPPPGGDVPAPAPLALIGFGLLALTTLRKRKS